MQLAHAPTGTLDASWDPATSQATLKLSLVTMAPNSTHTVAIYNGHCDSPGQQVRALPQLTADDIGAGYDLRSVHRQRQCGADERLVHCGQQRHRHGCLQHDRHRLREYPCDPHHWNPESNNRRPAGRKMVSATASTRPARRNCELDGTTLTINMTAVNLEPGSTHPTYLYAGSCAAPGAQLFVPLKPLVADGNGSASATSTVVNVNQVPTGGWIIMSHRGTNLIEPD